MNGISLTVAAVLLGTAVSAAEAPKKDAADGKALYGAKCATCHGKDGKGSQAMARMFRAEPASLDLTAKPVQAMKDADLTGLIAKGRNKMPAFKDKLKDGELTAVAAYLRTLVPKDEKKKGAAAGPER